jgi:hypothetical protein
MINITVSKPTCTVYPEQTEPNFNSVQRVRRTALALAQSLSPTPDLLTVELGPMFSTFTIVILTPVL